MLSNKYCVFELPVENILSCIVSFFLIARPACQIGVNFNDRSKVRWCILKALNGSLHAVNNMQLILLRQ